MVNFKVVVLFIKILACFISHRTFGNVIYDIVHKYSQLSSSKLRKLGKSNCQVFNVIPKFLAFNLPNTNDSDSRFTRKRLLRSALKKRKNEQYKLDKELRKISIEVSGLLSSLDC